MKARVRDATDSYFFIITGLCVILNFLKYSDTVHP